MSVIPFITEGANVTVVASKEEFHKVGGLDGGAILIGNLDRQQIESAAGNASYDLRVGSEYRDHRDSGKRELPDDGRITLHPGSAVIIETAEYVYFPRTRFGHIVPRVSLLQKGLSNTSSKVDPGYQGKLLITVFNLGKKDIVLQRGQQFCTLYVLDIGEGVRVYEQEPKKIVGEARTGRLRALRDYIETNQAYFTIISLIASIILVIATTVLTIVLIRDSGKQSKVDDIKGDERRPTSLNGTN
ncbi:MAG TPA: hypothetical protein VK422_22190 [Pyrinomonadaceae bacterium]|nr:hypothetical protein [Pyrinomonadaceae bacterium]